MISRLTFAEWVVLGLIVVVILLIFLPVFQTVHWVGSTDLEVEFAVVDASTGRPVPGASIEIHSEGGYSEERDRQDFALTTGSDGRVRRLSRDRMCCGTSGWARDTYTVRPPPWAYRVSAPGYLPTEPTELDVPENVGKARRGNPAAKLLIEVPLRKGGN
jgi:protocatechuate 3,4-dioxygenase beta subunit